MPEQAPGPFRTRQGNGSVLILGGTSAIAVAYARLCAGEGSSLVLAGRNRDRLEAVAADLRARGAASVTVHVCDLAALDGIARTWHEIVAADGTPSEVLLAYGVLGDIERTKAEPSVLRQHLETNFVSAALWLECAAKAMEAARRGRLVVLGSVAGDRGRQSNYPYGAAKGALERYAEGLAHRLARAGVDVSIHLVKPGFVDSPMTDNRKKGGVLWAAPDSVARTMRRKVLAGSRVFYVPWYWWLIMRVIRSLPRSVLHKTSL